MPFFIEYLLKLSIGLSVVWLFYQLVLRRLTFYNWNRWFLLVYSLLAFYFPFINLSPVLQRTEFMNTPIVQIIPVMDKIASNDHHLSIGTWEWIVLLVGLGSSILLVRLIIHHISFLQLRRSAKLLLDLPVKLYQVDKKIIPFSYGDSIFINQHQYSEEELKDIIRHEFVHVKQKHSVDMLWAECLCIFNWYNPFAWLIRTAIRQNLEFIADSKVVQAGIDKKQYQYLLLKVVGVSQYSIASNFNFTSLKTRIAMMNKLKSAKVHLIRFLLTVPLIAVVLLSFRNNISIQSSNKPFITDQSQKHDTVPATRLFSRDVTSMVAVNNEISITLKNGKKEIYNLNDPEQQKAFHKKYGDLPAPPSAPVSPAIPAAPAPPAVPSLPSNVSSIHINNEKVTIALKDGRVEKYDLNKPAEKQAYEKKYGASFPAAPKAPVAPMKPVVVTTPTVVGVEPFISVDIVDPTVVVTPTVSSDVIDVQPKIVLEVPIENDVVVTEVTKQTSREQLEHLKKQLLQKGYTLSVNSTTYVDGVLKSIEGTISDDNSKARFTGKDFNKIVISKATYHSGKSAFHIRIVGGVVNL